MGFFSFSGNNSRTSFEKTRQLVYLFANGKIKMNSNLIVEPNQIAYLMVKDRITDEYGPGNYTLSVATMPISARALNLHKKAAKTNKIIKKIEADGYIITKEKFSVVNKNSFRFVVKDKKLGRVESSVNFSCDLEVANPLLFLSNIRKFLAVVHKNYAERMLIDWSKDLICATIQKKNVQVADLMNGSPKVCEEILDIFVEKMQKLGVNVINFNMNKINLSKRLKEAFGESIKLTPFEETVKAVTTEIPTEIKLERVGMQVEGDRTVDATIINGNKPQQTKEVLNIDTFNTVETRPTRELRINFGSDETIAHNNDPLSELNHNEQREFRRSENLDRNIFDRSREVSPVLPDTHLCKSCGKALLPDDEFCSKCGTKVEK